VRERFEVGRVEMVSAITPAGQSRWRTVGSRLKLYLSPAILEAIAGAGWLGASCDRDEMLWQLFDAWANRKRLQDRYVSDVA
jgi:hypothetical protein